MNITIRMKINNKKLETDDLRLKFENIFQNKSEKTDRKHYQTVLSKILYVRTTEKKQMNILFVSAGWMN